jgi:hypothetical protein
MAIGCFECKYEYEYGPRHPYTLLTTQAYSSHTIYINVCVCVCVCDIPHKFKVENVCLSLTENGAQRLYNGK